MKKFFVYIHITPSGKRYIGITNSVNPQDRWGTDGMHYQSQPFYRAIKKYGWENISHIIYQVDTKQEMFYLEKYLIRFYNTRDKKYGYNISEGGESGAKGNHYRKSKESIEKSRQYHLGRKRSDQSKQNMRESSKHRMIKVMIDNHIFESIRDAADYINCDRRSLSGALKRNKNSLFKGHHIQYYYK